MKAHRRIFAATVLTLATALTAQASEDHGVGKIVTGDMNLSYIDHVLTGRIGGRPVFAKPLTDKFGIRLWHRARGEDFETVFTKKGDTLAGAVESLTPAGQEVATRLEITDVNPREGSLRGTLGSRPFRVFVTAPERDGHHYVDPTLEIAFDDGAGYSFTVEDGSACMGCVTRLTYATVAMLHSAGLL